MYVKARCTLDGQRPGIAMALVSWETDAQADPRKREAGPMRCLIDLDAPCNMLCDRCRRPNRGRLLGQSQALGLVETLAEEVIASGARSATAVFYGGEPLLARDQLLAQAYALRRALGEASVTCELGLITNGTRLDPTTALRLARAGFTRVCVTLGGTREHHEARRQAPSAGPSYRLILDNLSSAREILEVVVRYELCEETDLLRLPQLISDLRVRGLVVGERPVKVVTQPPSTYARQARSLFSPDRLRVLDGGRASRGDADPA
jgi:sulfatase maturation enzyme AslB (radical SAM superfamily)